MREFSIIENDLFTIRKNALEIINEDTLFKTYNNTNLNLIPLVYNGQKKVYVLTGPQMSGVVVIGNDYLLNFDQDNQLQNKRALHQNIIPIEFGNEQEEDVHGTMHTHLDATGEYITPTDICNLMLYGKYTKWKQHLVISENYISIWDFETNQLAMITKEAWDKINSDQ